MARSHQSYAVLAACAVSWACSVYDTELLSLSELTAGGSAAGGGAGTEAVETAGTSGVAGTESSSSGTSTTAGTSSASAGTAVGGSEAGGTGNVPVEGAAGAAGAAGAGGDDTQALCSAAPLPAKGLWKASASHASVGVGEYDNKPEYLMDQTMKRWSTGKGQAGDEWVQVDLGVTAAVRELSLTLNPDDAEDYPRIYQIRISDEPLDFNGPIRASGSGLVAQTLVVTLAEPVQGRYLLVQQKGKAADYWWSISELTATCF
ncbi:MAG TPA: discoidin domain-containing protein [Polyangiaceae bacterium]|nr:discoidin domain-containing protein [Polyangiaceae bacterium]